MFWVGGRLSLFFFFRGGAGFRISEILPEGWEWLGKIEAAAVRQ